MLFEGYHMQPPDFVLVTENILGPQGALPSKNLFWKILIDEFQIVRL